MSDSAADKTTTTTGSTEAPKLLFGAPVSAGAPSGVAGTGFNASAVRPFGAPDPAAAGSKDDGAAGGDGEDYSDPNFKPLVENLQKVEAKEIGDDEEKIFTKRSKVYRFFKDSNEWKERCVGDLNLIKNNATGRVRVEMRMEKTQRVQVNHSLLAETKITPGANSARMLIWNAYGDTSFDEHNEPMNVTLAARFQDDEGAAKFKKIFEECVKSLEEAEAKKEKAEAEKETEEEKEEKETEKEEKKDEEKTDKADEKAEEKKDDEKKTEN